MFNDMVIVQSAVSAFNNAALYAPAFLWWAILALPLFVVVWMFRGQILGRLNCSQDVLLRRISVWTVVFALIWLILFGGNYNVLRDDVSLLPFLNAAIAFVASMFIGTNIRAPWKVLPMRRGIRVLSVIIVLLAVGLSDTHAWWGPVLQIGAVVAGFVIGRYSHGQMRPIGGTLLVLLAMTTAILMQPEYFRFGQLGNLTFVHLLFVLLVGASAVATVALYNVNTRNKIHRSAYVKLKWMMRFIIALGVVLMFMTESVPVFLGVLMMSFVMFAMSIWHASSVVPNLARNMFSITLMMFGVITTMPVVSVLGLLYWVPMSRVELWRGVRALL